MVMNNSTGQNYTIHTEVYDGPLDLLLDLISKAELDITRVSLAKITDQYLAYLESLEQTSAVDVSSFLVIAAKLLQIKSEALLPRSPIREDGDEDPAEDLIKQLKIYKQVKETAQWLAKIEERGLHTYIRLARPPVIDEKVDLNGITLNDLIGYLKVLFHYEEDAAPLTSVVAIPRVTIKNKIREVLYNLRSDQKLSYKNLLPKQYSKIEAIILFLAILELIKQQYAVAEQTGLFSDIDISATEKTFYNDEIKLALDD